MGIQPLPLTTIRVIGASQVLNDPAGVIKELVDNALDARATSIAIEISSNTLDSIQVRDNGHGIPPQDRALVARPHCTSKIESEDDLKGIGGTSLGFRGEALASVAELSGSLTISTRVEGEQVAAALKINQHGDLESQERASLPVGTTVKITDFNKANPVRRQIALKNTEATLKKIKQSLQSYAFARPQVRLALRVLKSANDKGNFTYAPKPGGNAEDAAFKIVGAACASQCTWSVLEDQGFTVQAFLPRPGAEAGRVSNIGSFLSVDSRPVSASRGTPKQIVKIFRDAIKKANSSFHRARDPFIYLEIACPPASYDANVEPAKDDVLFEDPDVVVQAARRLFEAIYPAQEPQSARYITNVSKVTPQRDMALVRDDGFTTSLERPSGKNSRATQSSLDDHQLLTELDLNRHSTGHELETRIPDAAQDTQHVFRTNMYGCDEEDLDLLDTRPPTGRTEADFEELREAQKDVNVSNPWVIAKLNGPVRQRKTAQDGAQSLPIDTGASRAQPGQAIAEDLPPIDLKTSGLPTPRASSPSPPFQNFNHSSREPELHSPQDGRMIGSESLPPPQMLIRRPPTDYESVENEAPQQESHRPPAYDCTLSSQASEPPAGTPLHAIPNAGKRRQRRPRKQMHQGQLSTPFVSPMRIDQAGATGWSGHSEGQQRRQPQQKRPYQPRDNAGLVVQGELGDLAEDPRPLTPPRRNRDMRDFITSVDLTGSDSASSFIESRNYPPQARSVPGTGGQLSDDYPEGDAPHRSRVLGGHGFVPASELAAVEVYLGAHSDDASRASKRRKTSQSRILREVSGNAGRSFHDEDLDYQPTYDARTASRRRKSSKIHRSKSSNLPLERVPAGQGLHNLVYNLWTTLPDVSRSAGKIDEDYSLLSWDESSPGVYDAFGAMPYSSPEQMKEITGKLYQLLITRVSDGEMVEDLGVIVADAFAAHEKAVKEVEIL